MLIMWATLKAVPSLPTMKNCSFKLFVNYWFHNMSMIEKRLYWNVFAMILKWMNESTKLFAWVSTEQMYALWVKSPLFSWRVLQPNEIVYNSRGISSLPTPNPSTLHVQHLVYSKHTPTTEHQQKLSESLLQICFKTKFSLECFIPVQNGKMSRKCVKEEVGN